MLKQFVSLLFLGISFSSFAEHDPQLQYNFVQFNHYDGTPYHHEKYDGRGVDGSIPWGRRSLWFTTIRFRDLSAYNGEKSQSDRVFDIEGDVGIGTHRAINANTDWLVSLQYHVRDDYNRSNDGTGLHIGLRQLLTPALEWGAEVAHGEHRLGVEHQRFAYLMWHANRWLGLGIKLQRQDNNELQCIYLRASF